MTRVTLESRKGTASELIVILFIQQTFMVNSIKGPWKVYKDTNNIFYGLYNFIYKSQ